jgi:integrase
VLVVEARVEHADDHPAAASQNPGELFESLRRVLEVVHQVVAEHQVERFSVVRTAPSIGVQRVYVATTDQVWQLYGLFPARMRLAVVLGAFVGLRLAEACGLRVEDVDFLRAVVYPKVQYPARPLKSKTSKTPVPVLVSLVEQCSAQITACGRYATLLTGEDQGQLSPWAIERAMRKARSEVKGLPAGFRYHDLWHYFASLLIPRSSDGTALRREPETAAQSR